MAMRHRRAPNLPTEQHDARGQTSGPMIYGAGHREVQETHAGREYRESGSLLREWITTRRTLEPDPRYFQPARPSWFTRTARRIARWIWQSILVAPGLALILGGIWAAWTLGGAGFGVAAFFAVCAMIGWRM